MGPPSPVHVSSWQAAELNAQRWMKYWGFSDARVTTAGADGGIDVRSRGAVAQVKFEANQVGRPAVQRLYGARGSRHELWMIFFSGVGYSAHAAAYADEVGMALFTYALDGRVTPVNGPARTLMNAAAAREREQQRAPVRPTTLKPIGSPLNRVAEWLERVSREGRRFLPEAGASGPSDPRPGPAWTVERITEQVKPRLADGRRALREVGRRMPDPTQRTTSRTVSGVGAVVGAVFTGLTALGTFNSKVGDPLWFRLLAGAIWAAVAVAFVVRFVRVRSAEEQVRPARLQFLILILAAFAATALASAVVGHADALQMFFIFAVALLLSIAFALYRHGAAARSTSPN